MSEEPEEPCPRCNNEPAHPSHYDFGYPCPVCKGHAPPAAVPEPDAAFEKWWATNPLKITGSGGLPKRIAQASWRTAQSAQRDALAGLVERWGRQSKNAFETYTKENTPIEILAEARERGDRYRICAAELRALLEGQPE